MTFPEEHCTIKPKKDCREETRTVPKLYVGQKCKPIPTTYCEKFRTPYQTWVPKTVYYCNVKRSTDSIEPDIPITESNDLFPGFGGFPPPGKQEAYLVLFV